MNTLTSDQMKKAKQLAYILSIIKAVSEIVFYFAAIIMIAIWFKDIALNIAVVLFLLFKIIEISKRLKTFVDEEMVNGDE